MQSFLVSACGVWSMPGMAASIAFFMTVGKASPWMSCRRRPPMPGRAPSASPTSARKTARSSAKCVKTWAIRPARRQSAAKGAPSAVVVAVDAAPSSRSSALRAMPPSRPLSGRLAQQHRAVAAHRDEGRAARAAAFRASAPVAETVRDRRDGARAQSSRSGHSMQRGRFGVQIVAPRSIIACAKSPGRVGGTSCSDHRADLRLRLGQRRLDRRTAA